MVVVVASEHEGRGLGARLRGWAEHRDRARGSACNRQWIAATNERARALLLAAEYRPERSYRRLTRTLDALDQAVSPPAGVTLRPVDVHEDAAPLHALNDVTSKASAAGDRADVDRWRARRRGTVGQEHRAAAAAG